MSDDTITNKDISFLLIGVLMGIAGNMLVNFFWALFNLHEAPIFNQFIGFLLWLAIVCVPFYYLKPGKPGQKEKDMIFMEELKRQIIDMPMEERPPYQKLLAKYEKKIHIDTIINAPLHGAA